MQASQALAALTIVLCLSISNSNAEEKYDKGSSTDIQSNNTEHDDITKLLEKIIGKLDQSQNTQEEEVLDTKDGKVKVKYEKHKSGNGKYKITINKKQIKYKPKNYKRTYKMKALSKSHVYPHTNTIDTNTVNQIDINTFISKFLSDNLKSKDISATNNDHLKLVSSYDSQVDNADRIKEILIKIIQSGKANGGLNIDYSGDLKNLSISSLLALINGNQHLHLETSHHTQSPDELTVIAIGHEHEKDKGYQANGSGVNKEKTSVIILPSQNIPLNAENLDKVEGNSIITEDSQSLIHTLLQEASKNEDISHSVGSFKPVGHEISTVSQSEEIFTSDSTEIPTSESKEVPLSESTEEPTSKTTKEPQKIDDKVDDHENKQLGGSQVKSLVSKLCDSAKHNVIEFWNFLQNYLGKKVAENELVTNTQNSPVNAIIQELLKQNNTPLEHFHQLKSNDSDLNFDNKLKESSQNVIKQVESRTEEQTTTTDATVEINNIKSLTPLDFLLRFRERPVSGASEELAVPEKNTSSILSQYSIETTTLSDIVTADSMSDEDTHNQDDINPDYKTNNLQVPSNSYLFNENYKKETEEHDHLTTDKHIIIFDDKVSHPSANLPLNILRKNESEYKTSEKESKVDATLAGRPTIVPESVNYETYTQKNENSYVSQDATLSGLRSTAKNYPQNLKLILALLDPYSKINNEGLNGISDEYKKYIKNLELLTLQSIDHNLDTEGNPFKFKINPETNILLHKLLQLNLHPHTSSSNNNINKHTYEISYPDSYIALNKLRLDESKNKISLSKMNVAKIPNDKALLSIFSYLNQNNNSGATLRQLLDFLKLSILENPSDCRVQSYNELINKIIHFFATISYNSHY